MIDFTSLRRASALILAIPLAAVGGCSQSDDRTAQTEESGGAAGPVVQDLPAGDAPPEAPEPARFTSDYRTLDFGDCTVTRQATEGQSVDYRCPGRGDVPVLLHDGDGRYDLDAGVRNGQFQSIGAFNSIGTTIEWRLDEGRPVAVIFRLNDATMEDHGRSVLAVEKVGTSQSPGCRIAQIAGETPDANAEARRIADRRAPGFDCGTDEMQVIGNAL